MQTPRLCIDVRAAHHYPTHGAVAQETIDQLASAIDEEGISLPWIEKKRTVLLAHPEQLFAGQLLRYNTKKKCGGFFLKRLLDERVLKRALRKAKVSKVHRFVPVDLVHLFPSCDLNFLLPALLRSSYVSDYWAAIFGHLCVLFRRQNLDVPHWVRLRFYRRKTPQICSKSGSPTSRLHMNSLVNGASHFKPKDNGLTHYVVSSESDKKTLCLREGVSLEKVYVLYPRIRRFVYYMQNIEKVEKEIALVVTDETVAGETLETLTYAIKNKFSLLKIQVRSLTEIYALSAAQWSRLIKQTELSFYLSHKPFDWAVIPLELIFHSVPCFHGVNHFALEEYFDSTSWQLDILQTQELSISEIKERLASLRWKLFRDGFFDPFGYARQYAKQMSSV